MKIFNKLTTAFIVVSMTASASWLSTAFANTETANTCVGRMILQDGTSKDMNNIDEAAENTDVKKVIFNDSVTEIPAGACAGASNLEDVIIPNSVKKIGLAAFAETNLKTVVIPATVEEIKATAFAGIASLDTVVFLHGASDSFTVSAVTGNELPGNVHPTELFYGNEEASCAPQKVYTSSQAVVDALAKSDATVPVTLAKTEGVMNANIQSTDASREAMAGLAEYNSSLDSRLDVVNIAQDSNKSGKITVGYTFDNTYWSHEFNTTITDANVKLGIILYNIPKGTQVSKPMVFMTDEGGNEQ